MCESAGVCAGTHSATQGARNRPEYGAIAFGSAAGVPTCFTAVHLISCLHACEIILHVLNGAGQGGKCRLEKEVRQELMHCYTDRCILHNIVVDINVPEMTSI